MSASGVNGFSGANFNPGSQGFDPTQSPLEQAEQNLADLKKQLASLQLQIEEMSPGDPQRAALEYQAMELQEIQIPEAQNLVDALEGIGNSDTQPINPSNFPPPNYNPMNNFPSVLV